MITRYIRNQLIVFSILTLVATAMIVFGYAHIPANLGFGQMTISAEFSDGAGLYQNGNVALRGVDIGKVTDVRMAPGGVRVTMQVDAGARIGADARAEIHSVSAVGEQYVNLVSDQVGGPYLESGAQIPLSRTSVPEQIAGVLDKTDTMLASIPQAGLRTFLDEGYQAFQNVGPALGTLVDSSNSLITTADQNYGPTASLIQTIGPLLDTQNTTAGSVREYFANLAGFTDVLRDKDHYLRRDIDGVIPAARLATHFVEDNERSVPILASNMRTLGQLFGVYRPSLEQVLVTYPLVISWEDLVSRGNRGVHAAFEREVHEVCATGFDPGSTRSLDDFSDAPATPNAYCKVPHNDPRDVRGARNVPCLEGHVGLRAATVDQCFGREPEPSGPVAQTADAPYLTPKLPFEQPQFPENGPFSLPASADPLAALGGMTSNPAGKDRTWQSLMTAPLAH
jgi:phospholipid/cholesterol/gamma-HCH transport system substrate-binding protein